MKHIHKLSYDTIRNIVDYGEDHHVEKLLTHHPFNCEELDNIFGQTVYNEDKMKKFHHIIYDKHIKHRLHEWHPFMKRIVGYSSNEHLNDILKHPNIHPKTIAQVYKYGLPEHRDLIMDKHFSRYNEKEKNIIANQIIPHGPIEHIEHVIKNVSLSLDNRSRIIKRSLRSNHIWDLYMKHGKINLE